MSSKSAKSIVATFIIFILLVVGTMGIIIYKTPVDLGTPGNFTGSLMNGGHVLEDTGFLFYNIPKQSGIYRMQTDKDKTSVKISSDGTGYLQVVGSTYFYSDNNALKYCNLKGENNKTLIEFAKSPIIVGSKVYYLDNDNHICKYSLNDDKFVKFSAKANGEIMVFYNMIYYISQDGNIRSITSEGRNDKLFIDKKVSKFLIDDKYIYYVSENKVYSARISDETVITKIVDATDFMLKGSYIIYTKGNATFFGDINKLVNEDPSKYSPTKLFDEKSQGFGIDSNYFYFFKLDGSMYKLSPEKEKVQKILF